MIFLRKSLKNTDKILKYWNQKHLSVLIFLLSCVKALKNLHPDQYSDNEWLEISEFLPSTSPESLKYKWISLTHKPCEFHNSWTLKDDYILMEIIHEDEPSLLEPISFKSLAKWSRIAMKFNHQSKNTKLGKHCKERWFNHLSPHLNKTVWTDEEDILLLENAVIHNRKWIKIAHDFPGRTQHNVKNRFLSLIAREHKISSKKLSFKESCNKSLILSTLCNLKQRYEFSFKNNKNPLMLVSNHSLPKTLENTEFISRDNMDFTGFYQENQLFPYMNELEAKNPLNLMIMHSNSSEEMRKKDSFWPDNLDMIRGDSEKFREICFGNQAKWEEGEKTNEGKETDTMEENLEFFNLV